MIERRSRFHRRTLMPNAVDHEAKRAIAGVHEGDMLITQLAVLKRFGKRPAVDTIALRRRISAAVQAQDRYPFEAAEP